MTRKPEPSAAQALPDSCPSRSPGRALQPDRTPQPGRASRPGGATLGPALPARPARPARTRPSSALATLVSAGGAPFLATALVARLPAAMVQLGLLLVVGGADLGMGLAGTAVAAVGLGSAVGAPIVGRTTDRHGPGPTLAAAIALQVAALAVVTVAVTHAAPTGLLAGAVLLGAANPQVGSMTRARWSALARREPSPTRAATLLRTALGYETAADELGFVAGPVLAGLLVTTLGPSGALLAFIAVVLAGEGAFLVHLLDSRTARAAKAAAEPTAQAAATQRPHGDLSATARSLALPGVAVIAVGLVFGGTQTALTALGEVRGTASLTGLLYGAVGVGSAVAGLVAGRWHRGPGVKVAAAGALVLGTAGALAILLPAPPLTGVLALVLGTGVGTVLVTAYTWAERVAPAGAVTTVMTVMATSLVLGVSAGAAVAGQLTQSDPARGFLVAPGAGAAMVVVGLALRRMVRRAR